MSRQLRLDLTQPSAHRRENFAVSRANRAAVEALDAWRAWPGRALALVGPEGSGKTHLAHLWAHETDAVALTGVPPDLEALAGRAVLIEDADRFGDQETLFHLINMAPAGGALLLTSRLPPREWPAALPDLRSRFNALHVVEVAAPDDEALAGVLRNLFRERNIVPADDLVPYLLTRMERSFPAAQHIVDLLDNAGAERGREVNRALAVQVLEIDNVINDLLG